jgi:hypothetical protein
VGNGNDVSAKVTGLISTAVGSFDSVTGVTSETGDVDGNPPPQPNTFSLQLNTNFFTSSTCSGAAVPSSCQGWEQFVYSNAGFAFIQYWLINYATTCSSGWNTYMSDCWKNGANSVFVPAQTIANLANLSLTGQANTGSMDKITMSTGSNLYSAQNPANILNLSQAWQAAEFNIVGDCCSSQAVFNSGSTIVVRTSVNYGSPSAPSCLGEGFTGETNNLYFVQASTVPPSKSLPAVVFTQSSTVSATSACASATVVSAGNLVVTHDFNGDGKSDILWHDTSGNIAIWEMNGTSVLNLNTAGVGNLAATWLVVGTGDFNGDGYADILWRDTSGNVAIWLMNGTTILNPNTAGVGNVATTWSIVGTGDFNGDGKRDILWRDSSSNVAIWEMSGTSVLNPNTAGVGNVAASWTIVGTGDFNGDGKWDILWRDSSGNVAIWEMNGTSILNPNAAGVGNVATTWSIVGTGDFNADGKSDVLWHDIGGNVAIWEMNGTAVLNPNSAGVGNVATSFTIVGSGDFNADGKSDVLWRDTSGNIAIWEMNGTMVLNPNAAGVGNVATSWTIQDPLGQ